MFTEQSIGQLLDTQLGSIGSGRREIIDAMHDTNRELAKLRFRTQELQERNKEARQQIQTIDYEKAQAIAQLVGGAGVSIEMTRPTSSSPACSTGTRTRMTKEDMERACLLIMSSIQQTTSATHGSLEDDTGLDKATVKSAVIRLKKENKLKGDGRGLGALIVLA